MQIVSDRGMDITPEQLCNVEIEYAPLRLILDGKTYTSGIDLTSEEFYELISKTESFPTTSQPSSGEFAELYRKLAKKDPDILSIHISSGLSGTLNAAKAGAEMVPEANVTFWDTKTLSCPMGWQVEAAVRGFHGGWSIEKILEHLAVMRQKVEGVFTVATMKYLIHGGRISHIKALMASLLNIKPIIGVEKEHGTYYELGKEITLKRAIGHEADLIARFFPLGSRILVQPLHGNNLEGVELLKAKLKERYECTFLPAVQLSPVLGAHTGPGLVGMAVGPDNIFSGLPEL